MVLFVNESLCHDAATIFLSDKSRHWETSLSHLKRTPTLTPWWHMQSISVKILHKHQLKFTHLLSSFQQFICSSSMSITHDGRFDFELWVLRSTRTHHERICPSIISSDDRNAFSGDALHDLFDQCVRSLHFDIVLCKQQLASVADASERS